MRGTSASLSIAETLRFPREAVTQTFGILAVRGAGKSNTAAVMAEEMFDAGLPFVAIDPVGSWFGLRSSSDGKHPGLPIPIFGGKHGDLPLERGAGELLADLVVTKRLSCVLDLSRFESEGDKKHFLLAFARRLYLKNEDPLHLFLEEADDYIPQKPMRDEAQLLRAWENIVRRGRARGLGITLITQRSAAISKMVLTQVETLIAMRTTSPQDRAAIEAWVKYHQTGDDVLESLSSLKDGEAWVWSPHFLGGMWRVQIRRRRTFDSGATPKNLRGDQAKRAATLADVDLDAVKTQMAATIERAKAEDPRELRRQIAELKRQLSTTSSQVPASKVETKVIEKPVLKDGQLARAEKIVERTEALAVRFADFEEDLRVTVKEIRDAIQKTRAADVQPGRLPDRSAHPRNAGSTRGRPHGVRENLPQARRDAGLRARQSPAQPAIDVALGKGERIILTAVAQYPEGATREQLTILTGYKRSSRDTYLQRLQAAGLVVQNGTGLHATEAGVAVLGDDFEPLPTGSALADYWMNRLGGGEQAILQILIGAKGKWVDRDAISESTGYKRSSRDTYLQRLQARRLVLTERGAVRASDQLFD